MQPVRMRDILALVMGLFVIAIVIVGLLNFDLMLEIWVKVLIGVLFVGVIVAVLNRFRG